MKLLPAFAGDAAQVAEMVGPVATVLQVVVVQLLPEDGVAGEHDATKVGPVATGSQVVAV